MQDIHSDICVSNKEMFRTLFRNKEKSYRDNLFDKLKFSKDDPIKFFQFVKSTSRKKANHNNINVDSWVKHFDNRLTQKVDTDKSFNSF